MSSNKKIAVSGGFDPLHVGHLRMFKEAAKLGRLYVLLNSDSFLVRKKGKPFMNFEDRKELIEGLECVYKVVAVVDEDQSVCRTLRVVRPDVFCNGGDRKKGNVPEVKVCEELDIEMVWNVGGGKIRSSSELCKNYG